MSGDADTDVAENFKNKRDEGKADVMSNSEVLPSSQKKN